MLRPRLQSASQLTFLTACADMSSAVAAVQAAHEKTAASRIQHSFRQHRLLTLLDRCEAARLKRDEAKRVTAGAQRATEHSKEQAVTSMWWQCRVCDWILPTVAPDDDGGGLLANGGLRCTWREVCIGPSNAPERGSGLFAREDIRAFTRLDYFGVRLSTTHMQTPTYCLQRMTRRRREVIDAHPRWYSEWKPPLRARLPAVLSREAKRRPLKKLPADLMLCGLINEPLERLGEVPNMKLFCMPWGTAYAVAVRNIQAGEELLTLYGPQYLRADWESPYLWLPPNIYIPFQRFQPPPLSWYRKRKAKGLPKGTGESEGGVVVVEGGTARARASHAQSQSNAQ